MIAGPVAMIIGLIFGRNLAVIDQLLQGRIRAAKINLDPSEYVTCASTGEQTSIHASNHKGTLPLQ